MNSFSLDHLTSEEFEEFCYELLNLKGFKNLSWRRGTGLSTSPSDQGRDIEGQHVRELMGNKVFLETWFFECKHYKVGVPPDKISGALTWAQAECPNFLLLIASNFFSNPTKNYLENYKKNNRPSFQILYWEKKELEEVSRPFPRLLEKYGIHPARAEIALAADLSHWEDASLARIMRIMVHIADSSHIAFRNTQENDKKMFCVGLPIKYGDLLNKVLDEESRKDHRGIHLIPELFSVDLRVHQELPAGDIFNFNRLGSEDLEIKGFLSIIINILPITPPEDSEEES